MRFLGKSFKEEKKKRVSFTRKSRKTDGVCPCLATSSCFRPLRHEPLEDRRMLSITLFVDDDATPGGDGLAWGTAYDDLQTALTEAAARNSDTIGNNNVNQIWIAEGTYKPTAELEPGDARSASFSLLNNVALYGGFAGTEASLADRDLSAGHTTTLSGDLGVADDTSDNAYTVVYCGENVNASLNGLSIVYGNADQDYDSIHPEKRFGGGIYNAGGLEVVDSVLFNNLAYNGAAVHSRYGSLTINRCTISFNIAEGGGGGIDCVYGQQVIADSVISDNSAFSGGGISGFSDLTITTTTLSNNSATYGGGISHTAGDLIIADSTFSDNIGYQNSVIEYSYGGDQAIIRDSFFLNNRSTAIDSSTPLTVTGSVFAGNSGKGISNRSNLTVTNSTFSGNLSGGIFNNGFLGGNLTVADSEFLNNYGSGIYNTGSLTVSCSSFSGNSATSGGGINNTGSLEISNSKFLNNSASNGGGVNNSKSGKVHIVNSIFQDNLTVNSSGTGGGINNSGELTIRNSTITGNVAEGASGGGIYNFPDVSQVSLSIYNTIVAGNIALTGPDIYFTADLIDGLNNLIGNGSDQILVNNINGNIVGTPGLPIDPALDNEGNPSPDSPAINMGSNAQATNNQSQALTSDLAGRSRIIYDVVDIGAYEYDRFRINAGGPYVTEEGTSTMLEVSVIDPYNEIVSYEWDLDNDGQFDDATGSMVSFCQANDGVYTVAIKVTGDCGDYRTESIDVTVNNVAPTADAGGPYRYDHSTVITLDASGSTDPGDDIALYEWDFDNDGIYDDASGVNPTFYRDEAGSFIVSVKVTDDDGAFGMSDVTVTLVEREPTASFSSDITIGADNATFSITYADGIAVSVGTIDSNDILVTGPNGYSQTATLVSIDNNTDGSPRTATYRVDSPGNEWGQTDRGTYLVSLVADQVSDITGYFVPAGELGTFEVSVAIDDAVMIKESVTSLSLAAEKLTQNDGEGCSIVSVAPTADTHGQVELVGQTVIYTPETSFDGTASFEYTIVTQWGQQSTATVTVSYPLTFVVNSVLDVIAEDGVLTLREAIQAASTNLPVGDAPAGQIGLDRIVFDPSLYATGPATITLGGTELDISGDTIEILGPGAELLTIDANGQSGVFNVAADATVTIDAITISGGFAVLGAGIRNSGTLTLTNATVSDNAATASETPDYFDNSGGGISNAGMLNIVNSKILRNTASNGGGIFTFGSTNIVGSTTNIVSSTIADNSATSDEYSRGGGVFGYETELTITDSTITGNSVSASQNGGGGGIYSIGKLNLLRSTVSGNSITSDSRGYGGGISASPYMSHYYPSGEVGGLSLVNSTISGNSVTAGDLSFGGGVYSSGILAAVNSTITNNSSGNGGGLLQFFSPYIGTTIAPTLNNMVIAGNQASDDGPDVMMMSWGTLSGSNNFIGDGSGQSSLVHGVDGNLVGTAASPIDPMFVDPDAGDYRLATGSPAIDAGDNDLVSDGVITDLDGNYRIINGTVDIGAYEFGSRALIAGDANLDGKVDGSDVTILANNWQAGVGDDAEATWRQGDFNRDGKVDGSDVTILANNWQEGISSTVVAVSGDEEEPEEEPVEETLRYTPPANASLGIATVPRRESLPPRRLVTSTTQIQTQATDVVLAESFEDTKDFTAMARDLAVASMKSNDQDNDDFFASELGPYDELG